MRSLIRLYPASWRARYGDEFEAILEERPLGPFDVADVVLGAVDAQFRLRRHGAHIGQRRRLAMSLRIGGFAAILGAALWTVGIAIGFQASCTKCREAVTVASAGDGSQLMVVDTLVATSLVGRAVVALSRRVDQRDLDARLARLKSLLGMGSATN